MKGYRPQGHSVWERRRTTPHYYRTWTSHRFPPGTSSDRSSTVNRRTGGRTVVGRLIIIRYCVLDLVTRWIDKCMKDLLIAAGRLRTASEPILPEKDDSPLIMSEEGRVWLGRADAREHMTIAVCRSEVIHTLSCTREGQAYFSVSVLEINMICARPHIGHLFHLPVNTDRN